MKKAFLSILFAATSLVASAQLIVNSNGKVRIGSNLNTSGFNAPLGTSVEIIEGEIH